MKNLFYSTIKALVIISILSLSGCNGRHASRNDLDKVKKMENQSEGFNSYRKINSFMFLHKGMKLSEIINYLDDNSISHSKPRLIKDTPLDSGNQESFDEEFKDESFIDVYNFQIGNIKLKKFRLFFLNEILLSLNISDSFIINKTKITKKEIEDFEQRHWELNQIFPQFYLTIKEKYGEPSGENLFENDEYLDMTLSNSLSESKIDNPNRHLLTNSIKYRFSWNPWFGELPQEFIKSDYISIFMMGSLATDGNQNYIAESRTIRVNFINDELFSIISKKRMEKESPKRNEEDSVRKLEKEFKNKL